MLEDFGAELIINRLESNGYEAYYVGGCVRNYLLSKRIDDYDITTSASPKTVCDLFKDLNCFTLGIKHGTVSLIVNDNVYEVTTFRIDGEYSDSRHPNTVNFCSSLSKDLARRDFTVNAIAFNKNLGFIDDFNGIYDIQNRIIRCVGDPNERFLEDSLRILRALRFASVYSFNVEEKTKKALISNAYLLKNISAERINAEFTKTILGENALQVLTEYQEVIFYIIPWLKGVKNLDFYFKVLSNCPCNQMLRYAVLIYPFKDDFNKFCDLFKFSNQLKYGISKILNLHGADISSRYALKSILNVIDEKIFNFLDFELAFALTLKDEHKVEEIYKAKKSALDILERKECYTLKQLAVNGNDLQQLGFVGAEISKKLHLLLDFVIQEKIENKKENLLNFLVNYD